MKFPMHLPFTDFTLGDEKFTDFMASIGVESGNLTNEFGDLRLNLYGNGVQAVYRRQMKVKSPGIVIHWSQEQQKPASAEPEIEYVWVLQGVVGQVAPQSDLAKIEDHYPKAARLRQKIPGLSSTANHPTVDSDDGLGPWCGQRSVWDMIQHLNDVHQWKRERIADWLDTLEVDLTVHDEPVREARTSPHGGDLGSCICGECIAEGHSPKSPIAAGYGAAMQEYIDEGFTKISKSAQEVHDEIMNIEASIAFAGSMVKNLQELMDKGFVHKDDLKKQFLGNWPEGNNKEEA